MVRKWEFPLSPLLCRYLILWKGGSPASSKLNMIRFSPQKILSSFFLNSFASEGLVISTFFRSFIMIVLGLGYFFILPRRVSCCPCPPKNAQVMRTVTLWQDKADGLSGCCAPKAWWFRIGGTNMATKMATKFLFPSSSENKIDNQSLAFDFFELVSSNFNFRNLNFWPRIYQILNLSKLALENFQLYHSLFGWSGMLTVMKRNKDFRSYEVETRRVCGFMSGFRGLLTYARDGHVSSWKNWVYNRICEEPYLVGYQNPITVVK